MSNEPEAPKITLDSAIALFSAHREEWQCVLSFLDSEREKFFSDQRQAETPNDVMKLAGSISTVTELKEFLTPPGWR